MTDEPQRCRRQVSHRAHLYTRKGDLRQCPGWQDPRLPDAAQVRALAAIARAALADERAREDEAS